MTDAYENENLPEEGQPVDNVGQDEGQNIEESSSQSWEEQAKYFQSEKDKLAAENQKLKQYEEVGKFLESRPDVVQAIANQAGGQPQAEPQVTLKPDEFDPWEAYNDPTSASYKFRMQEMQQTVNSAVNQATDGIRQQTGRSQLQSQLAAQGMSVDEIGSFMDFADKHPSEYGLENVIKMWRAVSQAPAESHGENPLDKVRDVQQQPQPTGVLQGERPRGPKSDEDSMWNNIMNAGGRNSVL